MEITHKVFQQFLTIKPNFCWNFSVANS